jgi:hypothetical protein
MESKKKIFIHSAITPIQPCFSEDIETSSLFVPRSFIHDHLWHPSKLGKIDLIEKEIIDTNSENTLLSVGTTLTHFFSSVEKFNSRSRWQGDRIRKMFSTLSETHDITLVYYMFPAFESMKAIYADYISSRNNDVPTQEKFENFCKTESHKICHHKNVSSWKTVRGIDNIIVRPFVDGPSLTSKYFKDVFSTIGVSPPRRAVFEIAERSAGMQEMTITESIAASFNDVYEDNLRLCEEHLEKKDKQLFLETFYPYHGDFKPGISFKKIFGFLSS